MAPEITTPFGKIPLPRLAWWALAAAAALGGLAWVLRGFVLPLWTDWQLAKKPDHVLVDVELHVTRSEMAHHLFEEPVWAFTPPELPGLRLRVYDDALCFRWEGQWSVDERCIQHPDKGGKPPASTVPPTEFAGQGASLSAPIEWLLSAAMAGRQECPRCGPYRDQFDHPPIDGRWWVCRQEGEWATYCFEWVDGCAGWRRRHLAGAWESCFWWERCAHR